MDNENAEINTSKTLSFYELMLTLKKFWIAFAAIIILFVILGGIFAAVFSKPKYTATASIIVDYETGSTSSSSTAANDRNALLYGSELIVTINDIAKSRQVKQNVAKHAAEFEATGSEALIERNYQNGLGFAANEKSIVLNISYTTVSGEDQAVATVNQVVDSLIEYANSLDENGKPVIGLFYGNLKVLDAAERASVKDNWMLYVVVSFVLGVVVAFLYVLVRYLLDDTIRSKAELEKITGFRSIAFISDVNSTKKNAR